MVACAATTRGVTPPYFCRKGLSFSSEIYSDLVQDHYVPYLQSLFSPEEGKIYFQQDGAKAHTSAESEKVLKKLFGENYITQNPPKSPDLNVLDYHTWDHMDQIVQKCTNIKTIADLKRELVNSYKNVNIDEVKRAVESWPKRMEACLAADGDRFEHTL